MTDYTKTPPPDGSIVLLHRLEDANSPYLGTVCYKRITGESGFMGGEQFYFMWDDLENFMQKMAKRGFTDVEVLGNLYTVLKSCLEEDEDGGN